MDFLLLILGDRCSEYGRYENKILHNFKNRCKNYSKNIFNLSFKGKRKEKKILASVFMGVKGC